VRYRIGVRLATISALLLGGALLFAGPAATPASADTELLQSVPAADSTVAGPVSEITISFTQPIRADLSRVVVTGTDGTTYGEGTLRLVLDINVEQKVRPLPPGAYRVSWTAATGPTNVARGEFRFTVASSTDQQPAAEATTTTSASTYEPGGTGEWGVLGAIALVPLILFAVTLRRRYKRETKLPPYRPNKRTDW
jgi:methionine-rich copper-binding protein CopC